MGRARRIAGVAGLGAVVMGAATAAALTGDAERAGGPVSAFPAPGTPTALRGTEISLRGVAPAEVGAVTVTGSGGRSVAGSLAPHPDGAGASFVPQEPFQAGERVTVRTGLAVGGASDGDFSFTIARGDYNVGTRSGERSVPRPRRGTYWSYRSTRLKAPRMVVTRSRSGRAPGYLVLNTGWSEELPRPDGALIADDRGRPVWFLPREPGVRLFDIAVQSYRGEPVLTYWQGSFAGGWGYGEYVVLDRSYREIARVRAAGGNRADIHDMRLTPEGTALVQSYSAVRADLSRIGGKRRGTVLDNVIQEIDLATGRLLFEWHSLGAIALRESRDRPQRGKPFDYFHLNSIDVAPDGDLLISARNTCAVYEIDRTTGAVNWRLGGKRSDFRVERAARFCRQHDARWADDGVVVLFDNHIDRIRDGGQSRAVKLAVDERRKRVRLLRGYKHPRRLGAPNKGSARMLANGNVLVGWGAVPVITEYTRRGRIVLDARFAKADDGTYRAVRADWTGLPIEPPQVAAQRRGDRVAVWASWNGATEVARWEVLAGADPSALARVGGRARTGFETAVSVSGSHRFVAVRALDARGAALGTSAAVEPE